jgi:hypothetical protein
METIAISAVDLEHLRLALGQRNHQVVVLDKALHLEEVRLRHLLSEQVPPRPLPLAARLHRLLAVLNPPLSVQAPHLLPHLSVVRNPLHSVWPQRLHHRHSAGLNLVLLE